MEDFNEGVDGKLAYRMRKVNSEQFHTLVRMHLSFELDLNTEDSDCVAEKVKLKKWSLISFSKKPKSTINLQKEVIEGAPLSHEGITQVKQLIEYLSTEQSIVQEGIFRRTGKLTRQQDLKNALYQGIRLNFEDGQFSVHDCASVLKSFLAELPEPLLTDLHYPAHCQIAELWCGDMKANECRLLRSLQLLLLLLPSENRILLRYVLRLLNKTASFEHSNKMNCDSLATLFTPHLLCPRKLSPEALHINSQTLSGLVAFMITKGIEMFDIPPKLATDIRAYWVEQERKLLSPTKNDLNESISDATGTAHTVFSFVDHKLTAKANSTQDTQAALAQLYAHIQAMPESAKKRRLVKQFNKENGQGTPRQVKNLRTKSLGDSIKKHIFQKKILGHKKPVDINIGCSNITRSSSEENILSSETMMTPRSRKPVMMISGSNLCNLATLNNGCTPCSSGSNIQRSNLDLTQKKSCTSILEECQKIDSMSGELVLTDNQGNTETKENFGNLNEDRNFVTSIEDEYCNEIIEASSVSITSTFREYLLSRSVLTASPVDLSFTSRTDDFDQSESDLNILNEDRLSDSLLHCLDGNQPSSDTSGIVSGSTNSVSNSPEKIDEVINQSPRKRGTNLQRDDSKKSVTDKKVTNELKFQTLWNKQLSESTLKPLKAKETLQETSF
ncbi:rho GTPase-activating protein 19 isoform X4 [Neodiprion fabricii]|uniref:rho GTPase-activating protein 19 isoform X4 n=1 Tax=Neodiprion fabricii TaxID=2872261 RepID=UPI001ED9304B|nr:rho GTPase-activating protein 19 isoform X4 [Neodiprion fabricii]